MRGGLSLLKILLYDGEKLDLPSFRTFNERVSYIKEKVLNDDKYKRYYNICATDLTAKNIKDIEKWWLGVKKVNNPLPIENTKKVLDYLTGYILGAKDFSTKHYIMRYLELRKKNKKCQLNETELDEFYHLKDLIIYEDKDIIIFENTDMEHQLTKALGINSLARLDRCKEIKEEITEISDAIDDLINQRTSIKSEIKKEYEDFQVNKMDRTLSCIISLASKIKEINREIKYNRTLINDKYQEYLLLTELMFKSK